MIERNYVIDQLDYIDPDDYDTWMRVGAALKHEGFPCSTWEEWSRRSDKHRPGECERKWQSFREENAGAPVTGGTIWHEAEANGWRPPSGEMYEGMVVCSELACPEPDRRATEKIIDPSFARESVPPPPPDYDPVADALRYLDELFEPDEYVGFCTRGAYGGGKPYPSPTDQIYGITVANVARTLRSSGDKFVHDDDAGAWIRFNPLDGVGCGNSNVTRYTYALVESDEDEVEKQYAILQQLNLPIKVLVHSGNKSLHAIVKVDAANADEYRERVRLLYRTCSDNGLHVDEQDKNASRYSRWPGFRRGGRWQYSIAWDIGARSWDEWVRWLEDEQDTLPGEVSLADAMEDLPPLKPELIHGLLRQGHKMLVSAPSKAGKSFLLMELAVCIAEGMEWIGHRVEQGRVLYVNMELDGASCLHRFADIYGRIGLHETHMGNISVLNLRGYVTSLASLSGTIMHRFKDGGYSCMIFDPLYKLNDGDENNAGDMTRLCNNFDAIARECGCSTVYSHHFSKGAAARYSSAMDRSSGSGVFARDPDCIVTMSELQVSEMHANMYHEAYSLPPDKRLSGWELSFTVREFPTPDDVRIWFDWPIHMVDVAGWLNDATHGGTNGVGDGQVASDVRLDMLNLAYASTVAEGDSAVLRERLLEELVRVDATWNDSKLKRALDKSPYRSCVIVGGTRVVARRDRDSLTLDGTVYLRPESDNANARWEPGESGSRTV